MKIGLPLIFAVLVIAISSCSSDYEIKYYENGNVMYKARKINGLFDGDFVTFYEDGKLKTKGHWSMGIGNGYIERFFPNGNIEEKAFYDDGKLNGKIEVYYSNGQKRLDSYYSNGVKVGEYKVFNERGTLSERHMFTSKGELYYIVKYGEDNIKEMEIFFPTFLKKEKNDSLEFSVINNVRFNGEAKLSIGLRQNDTLEVIDGPKTILDSIYCRLLIDRSVAVDKLYYRFEFTPSQSDTLNGFVIEKKMFEVDTTNDSFDQVEDFI